MFSSGPTYPISFAENLVPNPMIELYFIMQLLTVRGGDFESLADVSPGNISLAKSMAAKFAPQTKKMVVSHNMFNFFYLMYF